MTATTTISRTNATKTGRMLANATSLSKPVAPQVTVADDLLVAAMPRALAGLAVKQAPTPCLYFYP
jgi:hypothetical protein